jgi:hypothetical protein
MRQHANPFAQNVAILFLQELAYERRKIHPWRGHRVVALGVVVLLPRKTLTERCTMALGLSTEKPSLNFHHVVGL